MRFYNFDEFEYSPEEIREKKIKTKSILKYPPFLEEIIQRLDKSPVYDDEKTLKEFTKYAINFDNPERALTILHNCYTIKINNDQKPNYKKLIKTIDSYVSDFKVVAFLEKVVDKLTQKEEYSLTEEEIQSLNQDKENIKMRMENENKKEEEKNNKKASKSKKKNEEENEFEEESGPSLRELKKIEKLQKMYEKEMKDFNNEDSDLDIY